MAENGLARGVGFRAGRERESADVVTYANDDEGAAQAPHEDAESALWPAAADGRSGVRGMRPQPRADEALALQLLGPLGTTAYGRAYRAKRRGQEREVAVHQLSLSPEAELSHTRELPLLVAKCAQLSHLNVIALEEYRHDESTGAHYVITEALEGVSLASVLEAEQHLSLERALAVTLQIARALRAAHKLGLVHGALTPANVRLVDPPPKERVRVVGFGALSLAPAALRASGLSDTRAYEAPECSRGAAPDARSDVFSMASLLFHMLAGAPPRVGAEPPLLSSSSVEPIPRALDELVTRCLDPRPEGRVEDAVTFLKHLREIAARVEDASAVLDGQRSWLSASSLPPADLPSAEGDTSGSIFGAESLGLRQGALWIVGGLVLALAAIWFVWHASTEDPSRTSPPTTEAP